MIILLVLLTIVATFLYKDYEDKLKRNKNK